MQIFFLCTVVTAFFKRAPIHVFLRYVAAGPAFFLPSKCSQVEALLAAPDRDSYG